MRIARFFVVLGSFLPFAAQAAPPLVRGDVVVAGYSYDGAPPGACDDRICVLDEALATVTPISDPLPPWTIEKVQDVAVETPSSIVAVAIDNGWQPTLGTVLRVDVASGTVTTLASGFETHFEPSIAVAKGRIFVTGEAGILEVDASSGALSMFAAGPYSGFDAQPAGANLVTVRPVPAEECFPADDCHEFVNIAVSDGAVSVLPEPRLFWTGATRIDVVSAGDRFVFERSSALGDGRVFRVGQSGNTTVTGGEEMASIFGGMAADLAGDVLIGAMEWPDPDWPYPYDEITRWRVGAGQIGSVDLDFMVSAIDVVRPKSGGCGLGAELALLLLGVAALGRRRVR